MVRLDRPVNSAASSAPDKRSSDNRGSIIILFYLKKHVCVLLNTLSSLNFPVVGFVLSPIILNELVKPSYIIGLTQLTFPLNVCL